MSRYIERESRPFWRGRLDEYLQATLVAIESSGVRLQVNLMPGVAVADQVLAVIDRDRDGMISTNEAAAYAELLKRDHHCFARHPTRCRVRGVPQAPESSPRSIWRIFQGP